MRKSSKTTTSATLNHVDRYHSNGRGGYAHGEEYAFMGFKSNKYFTSDRFIPLTDDYKRLDGKPMRGYGLEIETECFGVKNQTAYAELLHRVIFQHFPDDLFKLQNDGSLEGETSAECITQVMTKEFIRNNYGAFKMMFNDYFPAFQISAAQTGNCGMHVNISLGCFGQSESVQADAVRKLYYIVNHFYAFMCSAVCRNPNRTNYASRMTANKERCKTMDLTRFSTDHGVCFNLGHYNAGRIELRLVGGQKDFAAFRNTMETIFFLVERVKSISWTDCDSLTKIFTGCNSYVFDRLTKCRNEGVISSAEVETVRATVQAVEYI